MKDRKTYCHVKPNPKHKTGYKEPKKQFRPMANLDEPPGFTEREIEVYETNKSLLWAIIAFIAFMIFLLCVQTCNAQKNVDGWGSYSAIGHTGTKEVARYSRERTNKEAFPELAGIYQTNDKVFPKIAKIYHIDTFDIVTLTESELLTLKKLAFFSGWWAHENEMERPSVVRIKPSEAWERYMKK